MECAKRGLIEPLSRAAFVKSRKRSESSLVEDSSLRVACLTRQYQGFLPAVHSRIIGNIANGRLAHGRPIRLFGAGIGRRLGSQAGMCCVFETSRRSACRTGLPVLHAQYELRAIPDARRAAKLSLHLCATAAIGNRRKQTPTATLRSRTEDQARFVVVAVPGRWLDLNTPKGYSAVRSPRRVILAVRYPIRLFLQQTLSRSISTPREPHCSANPAGIRLGCHWMLPSAWSTASLSVACARRAAAR